MGRPISKGNKVIVYSELKLKVLAIGTYDGIELSKLLFSGAVTSHSEYKAVIVDGKGSCLTISK